MGGVRHEPASWPILWIGQPDDEVDIARIGAKAWYLHRLELAGFPTAPACCVEAAAYEDAVSAARVDHRLQTIWDTAAHAGLEEIGALSRKARHLISEIEFSRWVTEDLDAHLSELHARRPSIAAVDRPGVAVRSSATGGAVTGPECAGVHASYLDVVGVDQVIGRIHGCWASLFSEPALTLRARGLGSGVPSMAVIVQTMVHAAKSGVITPTGSTSEMLVEATYGLGEPIITGAVEPDRYVVDRLDHTVRSMTIGRKQIVVPDTIDVGGDRSPAPDRRTMRVLSDGELRELSDRSRAVDVCFGEPHEVEWVIDDHRLSVIQSRPMTPGHHIDSPSGAENVNGIGIGLGWATGRVRIVDRFEELTELQPNEILVTAETTPEWAPNLGRSAAVITDEGDATCHAARVARELDIPAIVGTGDATTRLETGMYVTVDAGRGWVIPSVTFATTL